MVVQGPRRCAYRGGTQSPQFAVHWPCRVTPAPVKSTTRKKAQQESARERVPQDLADRRQSRMIGSRSPSTLRGFAIWRSRGLAAPVPAGGVAHGDPFLSAGWVYSQGSVK